MQVRFSTLLAGIAVAAQVSPIAAQSGPAIGWGFNVYGQASPPTGNFIRIAASPTLGAGIREDGTLAAWGSDQLGQLNVPAGTFTQLSTGGAWGLALRTNGTLAGWGSNEQGQVTGAPPGTYIQVAAGNSHGLALRPDRTLATWGMGIGNPPIGQFLEVRGGTNFSLGIRVDGTLLGWGDNQWGQLSVPAGTYTSIAAGDSFGAAVATDGTLRSWGGILGGFTPMPQPPQGNDYVRVFAGLGDFAVAIRANGRLVAWGRDGPNGELNVPAGSFLTAAAGGGFGLAIVPGPGTPIAGAFMTFLIFWRRSRSVPFDRR